MKAHTAAERRFFENAALIGAQRVIFNKLTEVGVPVFKLGEIAETASGGTPDRINSTYFDGPIPWLKSGELTDGLVTEIQETITESGLANSNAKVFPVGTLLIALYGATVGKTGILGVEAATNQAVCAVVPRQKDIRGDYLFWFLRYKREHFLRTSYGGAQPNISQGILRNTLVPLPSTDIQDAIAAFLKAVEKRTHDSSVPLPELPSSLAEQRGTVKQIEKLVTQFREARRLRNESDELRVALWISHLEAVFQSLEKHSQPVGRILERKKRTVLLQQGTIYHPAGLTKQAKGIIAYPPISSADTKYQELYALEKGDLVYSKLKVWEGSLGREFKIEKIEHEGVWSRLLRCISA